MQIGDTYEIRGTVTEASTAQSVGSGGLPVFSTPYMIAMMENAAYTLLQRELPEGKTSVGTKLDVFHVAASPVGIGLRARIRHLRRREVGRVHRLRLGRHGAHRPGLAPPRDRRRRAVPLQV